MKPCESCKNNPIIFCPPSPPHQPVNLWIMVLWILRLCLQSIIYDSQISSLDRAQKLKLAGLCARFAGVRFFWIPSRWPYSYLKCAQSAAALLKSSLFLKVGPRAHVPAVSNGQHMLRTYCSASEWPVYGHTENKHAEGSESHSFGSAWTKYRSCQFNEQPVNWHSHWYSNDASSELAKFPLKVGKGSVNGHLQCPNV